MKNVRVFIGRELVCFASVADSVKSEDILYAISKPIDQLASIRTIMEPTVAAVGVDLWDHYVDRFCEMHQVSRGVLLSRSRKGEAPKLRSLLIDSWQQATYEQITRTAVRMQMHHSSLLSMSDRLARLEIKDRRLRKLHFDTIAMCKAIITKISL